MTQWIGPIIMFVAVVLAVTIPAAIVIVMRGRRSTAELPAIEDRLARIKNAVESIAIEVERISESQRFSAKLQADPERQRLEK